MALRFSWRRLHGPEIVAQVEFDASIEAWRARVTHNSPETDASPTTLPKRFPRLLSAQAAADQESRLRYAHRCDFKLCGDWFQWIEETDGL